MSIYTMIKSYFNNIDTSHMSDYSTDIIYDPLEMTYILNLPSLLKHFYLFLYTYFTKSN
jgi:hypothetical protein